MTIREATEKWVGRFHHIPKRVIEKLDECNGENQGDIWNEYYKNGNSEFCGYKLIEEKPQHICWNDSLEAELDIEEGE